MSQAKTVILVKKLTTTWRNSAKKTLQIDAILKIYLKKSVVLKYKKLTKKASKSMLKVMGFVYTRITRISSADFSIPNVITTNLFESMLQIASLKYFYIISTWQEKSLDMLTISATVKLDEIKIISLAWHTTFFALIFLLKGVRLNVWKNKLF